MRKNFLNQKLFYIHVTFFFPVIIIIVFDLVSESHVVNIYFFFLLLTHVTLNLFNLEYFEFK